MEDKTKNTAENAEKNTAENAEKNTAENAEKRNEVIARIIAITSELTSAIKPHQMSGISRFQMDLELSDDAYVALAKSIKDEFDIEIALWYLKDIESIEELADEILRK